MARIFITGSADGLGHLAAKALLAQGHEVVLHARNEARVRDALQRLPAASAALPADLGKQDAVKELAEKLDASGPFDAVIHNAGLYRAPAADLFAVNTLAPYILTCLLDKPERHIYLSSDMHLQGRFKLDHFEDHVDRFTYSDTKLHVLLLCKALARRWPGVYANAVNPGWVPTKMGGPGAPDNLQKGYETQAWLAVSEDKAAKVSGQYFFHQKQAPSNPEGDNEGTQDRFIKQCERLTAVCIP